MAAAAAVAFSFAASLVLAEWLATGTGEGYARAGVAEPLSTESATAAASLHPGGTGDLVLRVVNPNQFQVILTTVSPNGSITSDNAACDAAGHGVAFAGYSGSHPLAEQSTTELVLADVLTMATTSANACQDAVFTVPVSLNGGSGGGGQSSTWFRDGDFDSFGDPYTSVRASSQPVGFVDNADDCNDTRADVSPIMHEIPGNGVDDDCDFFDEELWYLDADRDGSGDPSTTYIARFPPPGFDATGDDCDDTNPTVYPGATEIAGDGLDNNCDGVVDES